jgi:hypothetical protein
MKRFFTLLLLCIAGFLPINRKTESRRSYPQLWYCMPKAVKIVKTPFFPKGVIKHVNTRKRKFLQWLCGHLTGHEISRTEHGFDGDYYMDCHCRWCDELIRIPFQEVIVDSPFKELMEMMKKFREGRFTQ